MNFQIIKCKKKKGNQKPITQVVFFGSYPKVNCNFWKTSEKFVVKEIGLSLETLTVILKKL